jgi:hypothetical protein
MSLWVLIAFLAALSAAVLLWFMLAGGRGE